MKQNFLKKETIGLTGLILLLSLFSLVSCTEISDEISTNITIVGGIICNYTTVQWWDYNVLPFPNKIDSMNDCYRSEGLPISTCCPSGFECLNSTGGSTSTGQEIWNCTSTGKIYCWDYKSSQEECRGPDNNGRKDIAEKSWQFIKDNPSFSCMNGIISDKFKNRAGEDCYNKTYCLCSWISSSSNCSAELITNTICNITEEEPPEEEQGWCDIIPTSIDDFCADQGIEIWHFKATKIGDYTEPCENLDRSFSCETVAKMDFFGMFNIICVILILVAVYSFLIIKKNNKKLI